MAAEERVPDTVPLPVLVLLRVPVTDGVEERVSLAEGGTEEVPVTDRPPDTVPVPEGVWDLVEEREGDLEGVGEGVASTTPCTVTPYA